MPDTHFAMTREQRRRLDLVAMHGADQVSRSLSRWLRDSVSVTMNAVDVVHYNEVAGHLGEPDRTVAAVIIPMSLGLTGVSLFLFDEPSAQEIVRRVLRRDAPSTEWDELSESVMQETGNIAGTAFLNGLALALNLEVHPGAPIFQVDYLEAILDPLLIEVAMSGDFALLFDATIASSTSDITGHFSLLPDGDCFDRLMGSI